MSEGHSRTDRIMSIKLFLPLLLATQIFEMVSCGPDLESEWIKFKEKNNRAYTAEEDRVRFKIFSENFRHVEEHNKKDVGYTLSINDFADWKDEEAKGLRGHRTPPAQAKIESSRKSSAYTTFLQSNDPLPEEWDWRKYGYVTPVKNQKNCGSCWAFSTTATLETRYAIATNLTLELSEQNLVDCAVERGCNGGNVEMGYAYIERHGIDSMGSYPYTGQVDSCGQSVRPVLTLTNYHYVPASEDVLARAVVTYGAIAVAVDASSKAFKFYQSGILSLDDCKTDSPDHAMTVVGFGKGYWLLKNSWGEQWGERGYLRLARNANNMCGIASRALYPVEVKGTGGNKVKPNSGFRFSLNVVFMILPFFVIFAH